MAIAGEGLKLALSVAHVEGRPLQNSDAFTYVGEIPGKGAAHCPDRTALLFAELDRATSYRELEAQSSAFARYLHTLNLKRGDRIAYLGLNNDDFFSVLFGCIRAGVVLVPLNWRLTVNELAYQLDNSDSRLLIHDHQLADIAKAACQNLSVAPGFLSVEAGKGSTNLHDVLRASGEQIACPREFSQVILQMYTSGTTGKPKGTLITHGALSIARQCELEAVEFSHFVVGCKTLSAMPNFHIGGMSWVIMGLVRQGTVVVSADPSPGNMLKLLHEHGARHSFIVPTVLRAMINEVKSTGCDVPELDGIYYGAMPIGAALLDELRNVFDSQLVQFFGMTENTGSVTVLGPADHDSARPHLLKSVGKPYPGMHLEIRDPQRRVLKPGEHGEIWVSSPSVMAGYWKLPEATAEVLVDGWYATGDGGYVDEEGFLYLTDRIKDMIVSGGENVYPAEVEEVIRQFPGVLDAAVVGIPDEKWGEKVVAVVEPKPEIQVDLTALQAFCSEQLAKYKCPKETRIHSLPRTASGKVQRALVRKEFASY